MPEAICLSIIPGLYTHRSAHQAAQSFGVGLVMIHSRMAPLDWRGLFRASLLNICTWGTLFARESEGLNGTIPHSASPTYLGVPFELIAVVLTLGSIRNLTVL